jgi:hypothetical protein
MRCIHFGVTVTSTPPGVVQKLSRNRPLEYMGTDANSRPRDCAQHLYNIDNLYDVLSVDMSY